MNGLDFNGLKQDVEKLVAVGHVDSALTRCERYLKRHKDDVQAMTLLGMLAVREKDYDKAVRWLSKAHEILPQDVGTAYNLAKCLVESGDFKQAEKYYRQVIQVDPGFVAAYFNLANVLRNLGQFDAAIAVYRQAIDLDPAYSKSYYALSLSKKYSVDDPDLRVMEDVRAQIRLNEQQRMYLHFALAKAYDDVGRYDDSFTCLSEANRIMRCSFHYTVDTHRRLFDDIKRVFNQELLDRMQGCGSDSVRPVFVLGMPRSGTTLVEQILSSHPQVYGAGEIDDLGRIITHVTSGIAGIAYPEAVTSLTCQDIDAAARAYCSRLESYDVTSRYVINKVPGNFSHIGMIKLLFPNAVIIHCRRDPLATCFSIFRQCFSERHDYAYDLAELGDFYQLYAGLMAYWRDLLPGSIIDVDYEAVIADQHQITEKLLTHLDLQWSDSCLRFHQNDRVVKTVSVSQVRKPIYTDSLSRWSHYKPNLEPLIAALEAR